jgi:hypothetical protein
VPDRIGYAFQRVVEAIGVVMGAKLSPGRDGTISRAGHLAEPQHVFLSPGPDNGAEGRQLTEIPVHSLISLADVWSM